MPTLNDELAPLLRQDEGGAALCLGRRGPLAMSVNQAGAFVRSRPELARPNLHIYFNPASYSTTTRGQAPRLMNPDPYSGFLMSFNTCRPTSRGSIHIRSPDPLDQPAIVPNSLSTAEDVQDVFDGRAHRAPHRRRRSRSRGMTESEREPGSRRAVRR